MNSIKKNFSFNLVLSLCNYIFPLLTYPYASRVLGVEKIGVCNFVDSIINYFVLVSMLGIGSYGVREIAKCKENKDRRNFVFSNLITLNLLLTIIALLTLIASILWLPSFAEYKSFLWVGAAKLLFNMFTIEWFYQGIQDFKFITIRSIVVRTIYVITVFLFVHSENDAIVYFGLTVLTTSLNAVINWHYSRHYVLLSFSRINLRLFMIPVLVFGYYRILTSMYTTFNLVFLGFTSGDVEVGYFSTATKLYGIIMAVFTALTTVMVPKVSELLADGNRKRLMELANRTFSILANISVPTILFSLFCAEDIVYIIAGDGYSGAVLPFRIVIFLLLIIGMEQIVVQQFLMASSSNKSVLSVSTTGALVGLFLNFILTPKLGSIGSSISWGISELSVLVVGLYFLNKILDISLNIRILFEHLCWSFLYIIPLFLVYCLHLPMLWNVLVSGSFTGIIFLIINVFIRKEPLIMELIKKMHMLRVK